MIAETRTFERNTKQRQAILEELQKLASHPTASELYEVVRRRLPRISLGTVYRNLELLAQMGKVRKLIMNATEARYDGNLTRHFHLSCDRCGRIEDLYNIPISVPGDISDSVEGWEIVSHRLEFVGLCPICRQRSNSGIDTVQH